MSREQIAIFAVMNAFLLPGVFFGAALCRGKGADLMWTGHMQEIGLGTAPTSVDVEPT